MIADYREVTGDITLRYPEVSNANRDRHVVIAHDYVRFFGDARVTLDKDLTIGNGTSNSLVIPNVQFTTGIAQFMGMILPVIQNSEYSKKEHWGKSSYSYQDNDVVTFFEDSVKMVMFIDDNQKMHKLPYDTYVLLTTKE